MTVRVPTRRRRRRIPLQSALLLALLLASVTFVQWRRQEVAHAAPVPIINVTAVDVVNIPVPGEVIAAGTRLRDVHLRMMATPQHLVPIDAMYSIDGFEDAVAVAIIPAGLPLLKKNFQRGRTQGNAVVDKIPAGMRAMTIQVDATSAVEGWAGSGSIVDVLLVEKDRTTVVAEQVKILSAARSVSPVEGQAAPQPPSTVTILVSQGQCLAINTAIPRGRIALALRSQQDQESWQTTSYTAEQLRGAASAHSASSRVNGFARIREGDGLKDFALTDGRWLESYDAPTSFVQRKRQTTEPEVSAPAAIKEFTAKTKGP